MEWTYFNFSKDAFFGKAIEEGFVFTEYTSYSKKDILVYNDSVAFIIGDDSGEISKYGNNNVYYDAILFRTLDGGKTIEKKVVSRGKGIVDQLVKAGDNLFLVTECETAYGTQEYNYTLYQSTDLGTTWVELQKPEAFIGGLDFYNTDICIAAFKENDKYDYYISKDGLKTWHKLGYQPDTGYIFISSSEIQSLEKNILTTYNFDTDTLHKEKLKAPAGKKIEGLYKDDLTQKTYLYVSPINADDTTTEGYGIYSIEEDLLIEYPKGIEGAYQYGDYFQTIEEEGAYSQHIWSNDRGKTWHTEHLNEFFTLQYFFHQDQVWAFVILVKGYPYRNCLAIGKPKKTKL